MEYRLCWPEEQSVWAQKGILLLVAVQTEDAGEREMPCRVLGTLMPGMGIPQESPPRGDSTVPAEDQAARLLAAVGVPVNLLGCAYLRTALTEVLTKPELLRGMSRRLYPEVARRHGVSAGSVERAIRHAIGQTWARGGAEHCRRLMGRYVSCVGDRPTNGEFITLLRDCLVQTLRAE